jgi:hypothetical protein
VRPAATRTGDGALRAPGSCGDSSPEAGVRSQGQPAVGASVVLAVAEEGEAVVGEPVQEAGGDLRRARLGGRPVQQVVGRLEGPVLHARPVAHGRADVVEHGRELLLERGALLRLELPVDLDADPRLDLEPGVAASAGRRSSSEPASSREAASRGVGDADDGVPATVSDEVRLSTRNGMSSVTTSTVVRAGARGVRPRPCARPPSRGVRRRPGSTCEATAATRSSAPRSARSSAALWST